MNNPYTSEFDNEFVIIETDDGLTVAMLEGDVTPEETAERQGGVLVDPGPYKTYDDAIDAIADMMGEPEEQR